MLPPEPAGEEAQALLRQLMAIYDVKTLVAFLLAVGDRHWSPAILKRVASVERAASRITANEYARLATLLPPPPAHHPRYAFRFVDLFAGIGGIRSGFEATAGSVFSPANGISTRCAPTKPTGIVTRTAPLQRRHS